MVLQEPWRHLLETIKNKGIRYHIGCGGEVVGGTCLRCGERQEKKGLLKKVFGEGPVFIKKKDLEEIKRTEHRKRIRKGKDIFKR